MANDNNEIPPGHSRSGNFEMNFTDVLTRLWGRKFSGVVFVLLSIVVGSFYLSAAIYTYTPELVLTPADQNAAMLSSNLAGLGSLRSAERRVGKECVIAGRYRLSPSP